MKSKSSFGLLFPPFRLRDALVVEGVCFVNQGCATLCTNATVEM